MHALQIMAQAERLSQLAAEHKELITAGAPACNMSGTMLGMQDRHAALADAIVDAEARISDVMRQKQESQAHKGEPEGLMPLLFCGGWGRFNSSWADGLLLWPDCT